jgi:hypothetical protein
MSNGGSGVETKRLAAWIAPFRTSFTAPTWRHVLVLVTGALLVPGRRTVASALRVLGLAETPQFTNYHRVLNRDRWCSRSLSRCLLQLLVAALVPDGPVVVGLDDTIERRWGAKIRARGIYRDPVRSSHGHFVKASGLRWLCIMLLQDRLGGSRLGFAVPNRPGPVGTPRARERPAAQETDRLGPTDPAANRSLAAEPSCCRCRR